MPLPSWRRRKPFKISTSGGHWPKTSHYHLDSRWNEDEMNRGQPKSLSFPTNSARSKLAKGSSRVRRPELIRFFPEGFDHSSPDLENYCLLESGTKRTQGLAWRNWARLVTTEEKWLLRPKRGCRITDVPYQHSRLLTMNNLDVAPNINKKLLYVI